MPTTQEILDRIKRNADAAQGRAGKPGIGALGETLQSDPYYLKSILGALLSASGAMRPGTAMAVNPPISAPRASLKGPSDRNPRTTEIGNLVRDHYGRTSLPPARHITNRVTRDDIRQLEREFPDYTTRERIAETGSGYVDFVPRQLEMPILRWNPLFGNVTQEPKLVGPQVRYTTGRGFPHPPTGETLPMSRYERGLFMDTSGAQNPFLRADVARDRHGRSLGERQVFMEEFRRRMGVRPEQKPTRERVPPNQLSFLRALLGE